MITAFLYIINFFKIYNVIHRKLEDDFYKKYDRRNDPFGFDEYEALEDIDFKTVMIALLGFFLTGFIDALLYGLIMVVLK